MCGASTYVYEEFTTENCALRYCAFFVGEYLLTLNCWGSLSTLELRELSSSKCLAFANHVHSANQTQKMDHFPFGGFLSHRGTPSHPPFFHGGVP